MITENELTQRVAVITRLRDLLVRQRDHFCSYLAVLDKQQVIIDSGNTGNVLAYVELEENITADIFSIQRVIDPLEVMYRELAIESPADDIPAIKSTLEKLKKQTTVQAKINRELISAKMENIRFELNELKKNPVLIKNSIYRTSVNTASLVDIRG